MDKENLVAGNSTDRIRIDLATERVKTVKDQSDMTVIGASDHFPGVTMIIDMTAPGQRLEANPYAAGLRPFTKLRKIIRGPIDAPERMRRQVRADKNQIGVHAVHQVKFSFCPVKSS